MSDDADLLIADIRAEVAPLGLRNDEQLAQFISRLHECGIAAEASLEEANNELAASYEVDEQRAQDMRLQIVLLLIEADEPIHSIVEVAKRIEAFVVGEAI